MATKLLFIGIDSMSPDLIEKWSASGDLPVLAGLLQQGQVSRVDNPSGFLSSVSLWPTFFTALPPVVHGYGAYRQIIPGSYATRVLGPEDVKGEPLWQRLSRAGKRVAVIDIPWAHLAEGLNGVHVSEWMTHDVYKGLETWPHELRDQILKRYGPDVVGQCDKGGRGPDDFAKFAAQLDERSSRRSHFARELLAREDWDLFMIGLSDSHCVGHQCWHLHDQSHPRFESTLSAQLGDPVKAIYQALDRSVGELMSAAPGARVVVYSSNGMGACYTANPAVDEILRKLDAYAPSKPGLRARVTPFLRRVIPPRFHGPLNQLALKWKNRVAQSDWPQRRFFALPSSYAGCGCVRFNLVGREPKGRVNPREDLEQVISDLTNKLMELRDGQTDKPVVGRVMRTSDLFDEKVPEDFPDLLIEWNYEAPITRVVSDAFAGEIRVGKVNRTGDHRHDGLLISWGESLLSGERVTVTDIAPALAAYLGVDDFGQRPAEGPEA